MTGVLITRPHQAAKQTAQELIDMGFTAYIAPTLKFIPLEFTLPHAEDYQALIFTSAQGVTCFTDALPDGSPFYALPTLCVGDHTAHAAEAAGFKTTRSAAGNAKDLLALIETHHTQNPQDKPYLYIRGQDIAQPLEEWLSDHNIANEHIVVYEAVPTETLPQDVLDALKNQEIEYVLFFSARTAQNFVDLMRKHGVEAHIKDIKALSISEGVLGCVQDLGWKHTLCADSPHKDALYGLLKSISLKSKMI